jgi:hypothetical protein
MNHSSAFLFKSAETFGVKPIFLSSLRMVDERQIMPMAISSAQVHKPFMDKQLPFITLRRPQPGWLVPFCVNIPHFLTKWRKGGGYHEIWSLHPAAQGEAIPHHFLQSLGQPCGPGLHC